MKTDRNPVGPTWRGRPIPLSRITIESEIEDGHDAGSEETERDGAEQHSSLSEDDNSGGGVLLGGLEGGTGA